MSSGHRSPEYQKNARIIRKAVDAQLTRGEQVTCGKCGWSIQPGQSYDVGHRIDLTRGGGNELSNLGPEHRRENRQAGGRMGAAVTNAASKRARRLPRL